MDKKIKVGIIGAGGMVAGSLVSLLIRHDKAQIEQLVSDSFAGKALAEVHKTFAGMKDIKFVSLNEKSIVKECDVIFIIKQSGEAVSIVPGLFELMKSEKGKKVIIDFSADFRLKDPDDYRKWYEFKGNYPAELLKNAVYGLSELYAEEIKGAKIIANPGCYPTSVILGLAPLIKKNLIDNNPLIIDSYSGVSGAGVSQKNMTRNLAMNVIDNMFPYNIATHRHIPEIEQELNALAGKSGALKVVFVPHIVGFKYGINSTIYAKLPDKALLDETRIIELYEDFYKGKKFVRIYPKDKIPELQNVVGTNYCDLGFKIDKRTGYCIITSMIDNVIKGAAGQALQNMNIAFGLDETTGLA